MDTRTRYLTAVVVFTLFTLTIPAANWTLDRYGFIDIPVLGMIPAGTLWIGLAFVLRDVGQYLSNRWATIPAIAVGLVLSAVLASPGLALASAAAFTISETLDWLVYTPLADRHFYPAVLVSSIIGAALDSAVFLWLAFDTADGWWRLAIAKVVIILAVSPLALGVKHALPVRGTVSAGHA